MKLFGLIHRVSGEFARTSFSANSGDFCVDVSVSIGPGSSGGIWTTTDYDAAVKTAEEGTEYYNADYDTPENDYYKGVWSVVEIEMSYKIVRA